MTGKDDEWITVAEAAKRSGYSMRWIQKLLESGRIQGIKPGRDWLTTLEAVLQFKRSARRGRPKEER